MQRLLAALAVYCLLTLNASAEAPEKPRVTLTTDLGTIVLELYPEDAPATVENFLEYVDARFYDGTLIHRIVPGFVIQGGGLAFDYTRKETREPVVNESDNGLSNVRGTVAMARADDPDSATSQFFINLNNNLFLDAEEDKPGYTVFGVVLTGMEVADEISEQPRGEHRHSSEAPNELIQILSARRTDPEAQE